MRIMLNNPPFTECDAGQEWHRKGIWPYRWIHGDLSHPPFIIAYRRRFEIDRECAIRFHISADERYELFLDGRLIGRGSERGDAANWYYESHQLSLSPGAHVLVARVWSLGGMSPYAQMSIRHGLIVAPEGEFGPLLGTGVAPWQFKHITGVRFVDPHPAFGTGANLEIDGKDFPWGFERGDGEGWTPAVAAHPGTNGRSRNEIGTQHLMRPAVLPPMLDREVHGGAVRFVSDLASAVALREQPIHLRDHLENEAGPWNRLVEGHPLTIPAGTRRRVVIDLENYYCAYPELLTSGGRGARISLEWAESLFVEPAARNKGNRDQIEDKYFFGVGDIFYPDGEAQRRFTTLWWQAGRYLQLHIETAGQPLAIERLRLTETRYPMEMETVVQSDDPRLNGIIPPAFRSLQLCAHETFIDCPYYEQLMYSGDTRLANLTMLTATRDNRLVRKCIESFDYSRTPSGLTQSRYPSRIRQVLAPFSLFWVGMVHDYALWRGDADFIRQRMRGVRSVLDWYMGKMNRDHLVECDEGWNFMDWVPTWTDGVHPGMEEGPSGIMNLQFVHTLEQAAAVEGWLGENEMAERWRRIARGLMERIRDVFWDSERGLFADEVHKRFFSEHAQCFAVLSGALDPAERARIRQSLASDDDLARTTISFTHYLFEAYRQLGLIDLLFERLGTWFELERLGLRTMPEQPEPTRSDCHGWGAHPIYHFFATILGVRPSEMGFERVQITPNLGHLRQAAGKLVHPRGWIEVAFRMEEQGMGGEILLPDGTEGVLMFDGAAQVVPGGRRQRIELAYQQPLRQGVTQ